MDYPEIIVCGWCGNGWWRRSCLLGLCGISRFARCQRWGLPM